MAKEEKTFSGEEQNEAKEPTVEELLATLIANSGPERTLGLMLQIINDAESRGEDVGFPVENVKILYPRPEANLVGPFRIRVSAIEAVTIGSASTV